MRDHPRLVGAVGHRRGTAARQRAAQTPKTRQARPQQYSAPGRTRLIPGLYAHDLPFVRPYKPRHLICKGTADPLVR